MAPSAKCLSFLFLLFLISSSSLQIHARESQFFSKVTRDYNKKNSNDNAATKETEVIPDSEAPTSSQEEEPRFTPQNHNGFGLYGHASQQQFSPNSVNDAYYTTPTTNFPEKANTQEYTTRENYDQKSTFNTGYPTNNYNYNGYETKQQGTSDTNRYVDTADLNNNNYNYRYGTKQQGTSDTNGYVDTAYLNNNNYRDGTKQEGTSDTNRYVDTAYLNNNNNNYRYGTKQEGTSDTNRYVDTAYLNNNNYEYGTKQQGTSDTSSRYVDTANLNNKYNGNDEMKQQGMSDTRFLENGKYFYGNNNANTYHDQYQTHNNNGYGSYKGVESSKGWGGYNGFNKNTYDQFTNSMEHGFQNRDEEFQETQQEENVP